MPKKRVVPVSACLESFGDDVGQDETGGDNLNCPKCNGLHSHIIAVGSLKHRPESGGGEGEDAYAGTVVIGKTPARRSALAVVFDCEECWHKFALVVQQHKGMNYVTVHSPFDVRVAKRVFNLTVMYAHECP